MRNVSCRGRPMAKAWKPLVCGLQPERWGLWETLALSRSLQVLGLLVWALIADTSYHLYPAYGWVMFVAVFLWLVTIVFFILYLFQLHMKLYMVPWPLVVSLGRNPGGGSRVTPLPLGVAMTMQPSLNEKWQVGVG